MKITRWRPARSPSRGHIMVMPSWASLDHHVEHFVDHFRVERRDRLSNRSPPVHRQRAGDRQRCLAGRRKLAGVLCACSDFDALEQGQALVASWWLLAGRANLRGWSGSGDAQGGNSRNAGTPYRPARRSWAGWSSDRRWRCRRRRCRPSGRVPGALTHLIRATPEPDRPRPHHFACNSGEQSVRT